MRSINIKIALTFILLLSTESVIFARKLPKTYFRSPVEFPITLSGNFGELRNDHFHSGIDIRTFKIGKRVLSAAEGYVSRIKISATGYGRAIYIQHPNGLTTVYGHLNKFNPTIEAVAKSAQYRKQSFEIDINLTKDQLPLKRGELIAYSGNTGSSAGPHLHFEIRDTKSESPLNPLLFNFMIKDNMPPKIFNLFLYPLDKSSSINGKNSRVAYPVTYYNKVYHIKGLPKITLHGNIGIALETNDYLNGSWNKCGIYSLVLKLDHNVHSEFSIPEFSFSQSRYVNSHMDYQLNCDHRKRIHKTFMAPNNHLPLYKNMKNRGVMQFNDDSQHLIELIAEDAAHNRSKLNIKVASSSSKYIAPKRKFTALMPFEKKNEFLKDSLEVIIPENCLYDTLYFHYQQKQSPSNYYSPLYKIDLPSTPAHKHFTVGIRPRHIPKNLQDKSLIVRVDKKGKKHYQGGLYFNGWVKTKTRDFGTFAVTLDTIAPSISPRTKIGKTSLQYLKSIKFTIKDDLSGIGKYQGSIDGKWVLFEYDAKTHTLFYEFDKKRLKPQQTHSLKIIVTDKKENQSTFIKNFIW